jgi:hypothetical protein
MRAQVGLTAPAAMSRQPLKARPTGLRSSHSFIRRLVSDIPVVDRQEGETTRGRLTAASPLRGSGFQPEALKAHTGFEPVPPP